MNVLVLNCGSSTVKFRLHAVDPAGPARRLAGGTFDVAAGDHHTTVAHVLDTVAGGAVDAVGHRVVHGGDRFTEPKRLDDGIIKAIRELDELAPLHNAPGIAGIEACRSRLGAGMPMVAVFDTAFHARMPEHAARYAIDRELAARHAVRRYGFHGTSYRYILDRYCELTGTPAARATLVAFHLGNGCSAAAIKDGVSVDTSMGLTPLEGLVMGTRAGDLDPALVAFLAAREGVSAGTVTQWLNQRSGLLGLSGVSSDVRDVVRGAASDPRARLALDLFCYRARKYLGAYLAALGGAQAVVFTGGIGEHQPEVREQICAGMAWCGLVLDPTANATAVGVETRISADAAGLPVFVIPTDEEAVIARDTVRCLEGSPGS
ncbi:MAG: acetate/propionate family kinase [Candidatus Rokuibacteriota bacterium]